MVLWRPTRSFRMNNPKRCPFHYRGLDSKGRKSRNTWGNRQIWPWSTERIREKASRVLPREHTGHSKHLFPTTQEKTVHVDITRWSHRNQIDYILCSPRWRSSIQSAKIRLGADCGSDGKASVYNEGDQGSIPGLRRSWNHSTSASLVLLVGHRLGSP